MTTAAMTAGMIPLILAEGAGARSRFAIGLVIASGISIGTVFTLFVTPAMYTLIARRHAGSGKPHAATGTDAVEPIALPLRERAAAE
jgi:Cu/Ag efflux pump CusA